MFNVEKNLSNSPRYILLDVKADESLSNKNVTEYVKKYIKDKFTVKNESSIVVIFPTHSYHCYVASLKLEVFNSLKDLFESQKKEHKLNDRLTISLADPQINADHLSFYGFYALKKNFYKSSDEPEAINVHFKENYGMEIVKVQVLDHRNESTSGVQYMLKADPYQKNLLEKLLRDFNKPRISYPIGDEKLSDSNLTYSCQFNDIKVEICTGDLLEEKVDIIVNASNEELILGGGISGAIDRVCGPQVQRDLDKQRDKYGRLKVTECIHTNAYKIPAKFILHSCGPRWADYSNKTKCLDDLSATFSKIISRSNEKNELKEASSIGIPLISSGIFGVPVDKCCVMLYESIREFAENQARSNQNSRIKLIRLVNIDPTTTEKLIGTFKHKRNLCAENVIYENNNGNDGSQIGEAVENGNGSKTPDVKKLLETLKLSKEKNENNDEDNEDEKDLIKTF